MYKRVPAFIIGITLISGGVFAASFPLMTAQAPTSGGAVLTTTCLNPDTAHVTLTHLEAWQSHTWVTNGVNVAITDAVNPVACDGIVFRANAVNAEGDELSSIRSRFVQTGEDININVPFISAFPSHLINNLGISVNGFRGTGPLYEYPSTSSVTMYGELASWETVANATSYMLIANGETLYEGPGTTFWFGQQPDGNYNVQVTALVDGQWQPLTPAVNISLSRDEPVESVIEPVYPPPPLPVINTANVNLAETQYTITLADNWQQKDDAVRYEIVHNGVLIDEWSAPSLTHTFTLTGLADGVYDLQVRAELTNGTFTDYTNTGVLIFTMSNGAYTSTTE